MKLSVSQISDIDIPSEVNPQVIGRIVSSTATNLAATLQVVGISKITLGTLKTLTSTSHAASSYEFFDNVPEEIKVIANRTLDGIVKYMSAFGIGIIEMELESEDKPNLNTLWNAIINGQSGDIIPEPVEGRTPIKDNEPIFEAQANDSNNSDKSDNLVKPGPVIKFNPKGSCCSKNSCCNNKKSEESSDSQSNNTNNSNTIKL